MTPLERLNALPEQEAAAALTRCCGASAWVRQMLAHRPYASVEALHTLAQRLWAAQGREDVLEAFTHHPRIGDLASLRQRFASTAAWSGQEQAGVAGAAERVLERLAAGNTAYEERFGYIFIVCATGRSAAEMLALLEARLHNPPEQELGIAAAEQAKILAIRLEKLLT